VLAQDLEQRQPLELVSADSIVPQDRHEMMLTSGGWYTVEPNYTKRELQSLFTRDK